jgi:hypothetical protein
MTVELETSQTKIVDHDSLAKARYAITLLRVAKTSDHRTAVRLIEYLASDFPRPDSSPEIVRAHGDAIAIFNQLALSLNNPRNSVVPWSVAVDAANRWLGLLE